MGERASACRAAVTNPIVSETVRDLTLDVAFAVEWRRSVDAPWRLRFRVTLGAALTMFRKPIAIRVARSLNASLYFRGAATTLVLPWNESLHQTRGGSPAGVLRAVADGVEAAPPL